MYKQVNKGTTDFQVIGSLCGGIAHLTAHNIFLDLCSYIDIGQYLFEFEHHHYYRDSLPYITEECLVLASYTNGDHIMYKVNKNNTYSYLTFSGEYKELDRYFIRKEIKGYTIIRYKKNPNKLKPIERQEHFLQEVSSYYHITMYTPIKEVAKDKPFNLTYLYAHHTYKVNPSKYNYYAIVTRHSYCKVVKLDLQPNRKRVHGLKSFKAQKREGDTYLLEVAC